MNIFDKFLNSARTGAQVLFPSYGGQGIGANYGSNYRILPGSTVDYANEVGPLWLSSSVTPILNFLIDAVCEAPLQVVKLGEGGNAPKIVDDHPIAKVIEAPSVDYDFQYLLDGLVTGYLLGGNAYMIATPSKAVRFSRNTTFPRISALSWTPWWLTAPQWSSARTEFISHYLVQVEGEQVNIPKEFVSHLRYRHDPYNPRVGLSPFQALLREIATDNEASTACAALMRNRGIGNVIIGPKNESQQFSKDQAEVFKQRWKEMTTGDRRGEPIVPSIPFDVTEIGFEPEKMAFDKVRNISVQRIFGAFKIDPMAIGMPSDSKTYSNYEEARRAAYDHAVEPIWGAVERLFNRSLVKQWYPEDFEAGYRLRFNRTEVEALKQDELEKVSILVQASGGSVITPNEARRFYGGLEEIEGGDELRGSQALERRDDQRAGDDGNGNKF